MFRDEVREHLENKIIPFWQNLKDDEFGGFTGYEGEDLCPDKTADKGCILHSRILWTFSAAAKTLGREDLRAYAEHAYRFMDRFEDPENGGCTGR